jgi:hypothetical protein
MIGLWMESRSAFVTAGGGKGRPEIKPFGDDDGDRWNLLESLPGRRPHARVTYRMPRARLGVFGKHGKLKSLVLAF